MRRLKFETGGRPRHNDDLQLFQENIYQASEAFFQGNGAFILSGCTVTGNDISSGVVFIDGQIKPFAGVAGVSFPCYISSAAAADAVSLPHETGGSKPTQTHLLAEHSASQPGSGEFITMTSTGGRTWYDAVAGELVRMKGNQTISGVKTFNSIPKVGSSNLLRVVDIINNLTSDATDKALSAAQGKAILGTGVPSSLNTLRKLAAAIGDDPDFAVGVAQALSDLEASTIGVVAGGVVRTKALQIGGWDMRNQASKTIAHGVSLRNIISVKNIIFVDQFLNNRAYEIERDGDMIVDNNNVILSRTEGGFFDDPEDERFIDPDDNRGWVMIFYKLGT